MINKVLLSFTIFGAIIFTICHGTELNNNENDAKIFLNQISAKLFNIYDEVNQANTIPIYNVQIQGVFNEEIGLKRIARDARKFDFENFKDNDLKYAFEILIKSIDLKVIKRKLFSDLFNSREELPPFLRNVQINDFYDNEIKRTYTPDIENIITTSQNPEELQYYWNEWRKTTDEWAYHNIDVVLKALKNAAKFNKVKPLEFWLHGYNLTSIDGLMADVRPLYLELHAFIRNLLREKYGESVITADGLIPVHLFEQVLLQTWTNESIIEDMFPFDSLPPVESVLSKKFDSQQLHKIAEEFYESLGFEKYPSNIWGSSIKLQTYDDKEDVDDEDDDEDDNGDEDQIDDGYDCDAVYGYSTPNILLEFCGKLTFQDFIDSYAILGFLHYSKEMQKASLPAYFYKPPQDLEQAIGDAIILSASTHQNLKQIGMIEDFNITQEVEMNRLLRMAIFRLINIQLDFVHTKVLADLVSGKVEKSEINSHYWQLMKKYVGVGPPKDHEDSEYDMPYNFYKKMTDNEMMVDFVTSFLSHQFHKKLCEISGKYPKEKLHLCDVHGSKEVGNSLKKMMQLGSSKPYKAVLGKMFNDDQNIKAEALLEYYSPIKKLLMENNKKSKVLTGWKESNLKKN
ncbi:angiotensin-converting enzyme-like [Eupeodes corollae]|uniref:angiotensin-converting enzyme-like n=1 Tax=Eupeodes corollae TaxID=290404 RepID=UPI0024905BED|nr:angiotensin-converting enzyme-like [Eupeodes corollae]